MLIAENALKPSARNTRLSSEMKSRESPTRSVVSTKQLGFLLVLGASVKELKDHRVLLGHRV